MVTLSDMARAKLEADKRELDLNRNLQKKLEVEIEMLTRLGTLSAFMEGMSEAMFKLNVFDEWAVQLQEEAKKTDELVQIWSSM